MAQTKPRTGRAVFKVLIGGTREEIFHEITRTDRPLRALPNARLCSRRLGVDARVQVRTARGEYTLADGVVLIHDPPRAFSHTVCYTRFRDPAFTLTYELRQARSDVELSLTLDDLPLGTRTSRTAMRNAPRLKHVVENGHPATMTRVRHLWASLMEFALPSHMLAEHWPLETATRAPTDTLPL